MATTRLLHTSRPLGLSLSSSSSSSSSSFSATTVRCQSKVGFDGEKRVSENCVRKPVVAVKASVAASKSLITAEPQVNRGILDLASLVANVSAAALFLLRLAVKQKPRKFHVQMFIERVGQCFLFNVLLLVHDEVSS